MPKGIPLIVILTLAFLTGCTPLGENIARKTQNDGGSATASVDPSGHVARGSQSPRLDAATRQIIQEYGPTIKRYSAEYGFDWRFILAVMKQESRFETDAESEKGAAGLMQIMPVTGAEMARRLSLEDLSHPGANIRAGIYYLRSLYDLFEGAGEADRLKLTLASYNAGVGRVYDAQEIAAYLQDNPSRWQSVKDALPLLSRRYGTLHQYVWEQQKPRNGWFGGSHETVAYVESVLEHYDRFLQDLN